LLTQRIFQHIGSTHLVFGGVEAIQKPVACLLLVLERQVFADDGIFYRRFEIERYGQTAGGSYLQSRVFAKHVWQGVEHAHEEHQQN
jgi:hypothetical protein